VPRLAAYLVAIPPITLATFVANRTWVFATAEAAGPVATARD